MSQAVILLSGGIDSATTLAIAQQQGYAMHALSFHYGQRHAIELTYAKKIAHHAQCPHTIIHIHTDIFQHTALVDRPMPPPQETPSTDTIPATYVPARNNLFLAYALSYAESRAIDTLFLGANAIDYSGYPDCRPAFLTSWEKMANLATKRGVDAIEQQQPPPIALKAPLLHMTKADIIKKGYALGVDYALTLSCYNPSASGTPCMVCDSCRWRAKGFADSAMDDPALKG
ncbi:MAG: 7-cyano-7-deazaguanine synthase QueC [Alphaproteobacteria bacterium GM7ARS4]|nr:7-cyano-7-deazaguanine synthase QueC [Alphaproteobacteria bacterium GM7ARS4]